jgi:hypothetical protein
MIARMQRDEFQLEDGGFYSGKVWVPADVAERIRELVAASGLADAAEAEEAVMRELILRGLDELEQSLGLK